MLVLGFGVWVEVFGVGIIQNLGGIASFVFAGLGWVFWRFRGFGVLV